MQPQLSIDLIKIMEQKLVALEHRAAVLQGIMNQVIIYTFLSSLIPCYYALCLLKNILYITQRL